jgi:guanidinopropionase
MIKQPARYQDFQDPQARPRYTGIPTFFRCEPTQDLAMPISASSACRMTAA